METTLVAEVLGYAAVIAAGLTLVVLRDDVYRARRKANRAARRARRTDQGDGTIVTALACLLVMGAGIILTTDATATGVTTAITTALEGINR